MKIYKKIFKEELDFFSFERYPYTKEILEVLTSFYQEIGKIIDTNFSLYDTGIDTSKIHVIGIAGDVKKYKDFLDKIKQFNPEGRRVEDSGYKDFYTEIYVEDRKEIRKFIFRIHNNRNIFYLLRFFIKDEKGDEILNKIKSIINKLLIMTRKEYEKVEVKEPEKEA